MLRMNLSAPTGKPRANESTLNGASRGDLMASGGGLLALGLGLLILPSNPADRETMLLKQEATYLKKPTSILKREPGKVVLGTTGLVLMAS